MMERVWNYFLTKVIVKPICNNHNELKSLNIVTIGTFKILKLKKNVTYQIRHTT